MLYWSTTLSWITQSIHAITKLQRTQDAGGIATLFGKAYTLDDLF